MYQYIHNYLLSISISISIYQKFILSVYAIYLSVSPSQHLHPLPKLPQQRPLHSHPLPAPAARPTARRPAGGP